MTRQEKYTYDTEKLNSISPADMEAAGLLTKSARGERKPNHGYNCVYCSSGTGKNQSGALNFDFKGGYWAHFCHVCGNGGDNLKFFQHVFNADFQDACKQASDMFGVPYTETTSNTTFTPKKRPPLVDDGYKFPPSMFRVPDKTAPEQVPLIKADIADAQKLLGKLPDDQRRGLWLETLQYFGCGFAPQWIHPVTRLGGKTVYNPLPRIIIPSADGEHYNAVALDRDRQLNRGNPDFKPKMHAGAKTQLFNEADIHRFETVMFVEGEIDAMSIWQAVCMCNKPNKPVDPDLQQFGIVATYGTAGWKNLFLSKFDAGLFPWRKVIILFDKDAESEAGQSAAEQFKAALNERNIPAYVAFINDLLLPDEEDRLGNKVDANKYLTTVGNYSLREIITRIVADAEREFGDIHPQTSLDIDSPKKSPVGNAISDAMMIQSAKSAVSTDKPQVEHGATADDNQRDVKSAVSTDAAQSAPDTPHKGINLYEHGWDDVEAANPGDDESTAADNNQPAQGDNEAADGKTDAKTEAPPRDPVDIALDEWQVISGEIEPSRILEIKDAVKFVRSLTVENITADIALDEKTKQALALCVAFGFKADANNFVDRLKKAKLNADNTDPIQSVDIKDLRGDVRKTASEYEKAHKTYRRKCIQEAAAAQKQAELEAYLAENHSTRKVVPDCPVDLILPPEVLFDAGKVGTKNFDTDRIFQGACNPIVPTKRYRDPVTGSICYEVAIKSKGAWRTFDFDAKTLNDPRRVIELAEYGACIRNAKYLAEYFALIIAANDETFAEVKSCKQTGWLADDDDFTEFAYPKSDCVVRRPGYDFDKVFNPKGDADEWKQKFGEVMTHGGARARVAMGTTAAAFLVRPLNLPNLQLHIWGTRSIGKTPLEKFCVSAFGDANLGGLAYSFGATTPKSRLELATAYRDLPLIGEELESMSKKDAERYPQDIYNYSLGISGQVLHNVGTMRDPKFFSGACLTSGEHDITQLSSNAGEIKRVLSIRCKELLPEEFAADLHAFCNRHHGHFLSTWTQYISKHRDEINRAFHNVLKKGQETASDRDATQLKTLVAAVVAYQHFKVAIGLQAKTDPVELSNDLDEIIATLPTSAEIDDSKRALDFLQSFIAANKKSFDVEVEDKNGNTETFRHFSIESYGKIFVNGEVAFFPHELIEILEKKFKSANKIIAEFADAGLLITNEGERTHKTFIDRDWVRTYHFKTGTFDISVAPENYYEYLQNMQ